MYLALYSIGRFFIEGLRTDSLMLGNLRMAQVVSIVLILLSITVVYILKKRNR
jgi:phosphatidylglycerol:prolipoprotein diacylglycerol transferase